jgi:hypothetical protein
VTSPDEVDVDGSADEDDGDLPDIREILMAARCGFASACVASPHGPHEPLAHAAAESALADVDCLRLVAGEPELVVAAIELADTSPADAAYAVCLAVIEEDLVDDMAVVVKGLRGAGSHFIAAAVEALLASPSIGTVQDLADDERIGQLALEDVLLDSLFLEVVATLIAATSDDDGVARAVEAAIDTVVEEYADDPRGIVEAVMQIPDLEARTVDGIAGSVVDLATGALRGYMRTTITEAVRRIQLDRPTTIEPEERS